jgi:hypothetical protein
VVIKFLSLLDKESGKTKNKNFKKEKNNEKENLIKTALRIFDGCDSLYVASVIGVCGRDRRYYAEDGR